MAEEGSERSIDRGRSSLDPDQAFSLLGNETRIQILQELGEGDGPLSFTELRNRVGIRQGSQFNYHLDKLVGHFIEKSEDGYELREPGRRVMQAIVSGAVTEDPRRDATRIEFPCLYCNESVDVRYARGKVRISCSNCGGSFEPSEYSPPSDTGGVELGNVANLSLPPAGALERPADEMFRAAGTLTHIECLAASGNVCPRCTAPIQMSIASVCEEHHVSGDLCDVCEHRNGVRIRFECTNCVFERTAPAIMGLLDVPELMRFAADHGLNTTDRGIEWGWYYDEAVLQTEPYEFEFTFTLGDDELTLTVDEEFNVTSV
jgi:transcription elongation factor Elf1